MRFIWTYIWAFLISCVLTYILSNMGGTEFDLLSTFVLSIIFTIAVLILGGGVLKEEKN